MDDMKLFMNILYTVFCIDVKKEVLRNYFEALLNLGI